MTPCLAAISACGAPPVRASATTAAQNSARCPAFAIATASRTASYDLKSSIAGRLQSAEEALDWLSKNPADLLVLDWGLPGMNGLELCQRLRKDEAHRALPILFLTGHSSSRDLVEAFAAGADDFVSKPFRAPELRARVLGLLRRVTREGVVAR